MSTKVQIQKVGRFLSGMVMPNIGAFIAWGLITALFIPTGWWPNERLAALVGPMITYLLPLLIGYTGGKLVAGERGALVGSIMTIGVIVGTNIPMFLGAMISGGIGGLCIKYFDRLTSNRIKPGFEMLVNNFSAGIIGMILAMLAFLYVGPIISIFSKSLGEYVRVLVNNGMLPLTSIFVEPAKILFLNNAINHGVFSPLGVAESSLDGKSILFLIETNPGPGLGILLAYMLFGKGNARATAPGSIIIHFLGGIHEIYFPYVLAKPQLLLAAILGGASGVATFSVTNSGLVAPPSPGSIIALIAMTPKGGLFGVIAGVAVSTAVSFIVASGLLKMSNQSDNDNYEEMVKKSKGMKLSKEGDNKVLSNSIKKIYVACDAGMGSSAMGATLLSKELKKLGVDIEVKNIAIDMLDDSALMVVTHKNLADRARQKAKNADVLEIVNFLDSNFYKALAERLK